VPIDKRYVLNPTDPESRTWLELQDWRGVPDDGEPRLELVLKEDAQRDEDDEMRVWLTTPEARQLVAVLNVMLKRADQEDLLLVNGQDGLRES
jgi:hypothetical protein